MIRAFSISRDIDTVQINVHIQYEDTAARESVKASGYRWDSLGKVWYRTFSNDTVGAELARLIDEGYALFSSCPREAAKTMVKSGLQSPMNLAIFGMDGGERWESANYVAERTGEVEGTHWQTGRMVSIDPAYRERNQPRRRR